MKQKLRQLIGKGAHSFFRKTMRTPNSEWVRAMTAEIDSIQPPKDAVIFAIGCYLALMKETFRMLSYEKPLRIILALAAISWAGAKAYLALSLFQRGGIESSLLNLFLLIGALTLSGVSYLALATALFRDKYISAGIFAMGALMANAVFFAVTHFNFVILKMVNSVSLTWYFAVVCEEYFVWSIFFIAIAGLAYLRKPARAMLRV